MDFPQALHRIGPSPGAPAPAWPVLPLSLLAAGPVLAAGLALGLAPRFSLVAPITLSLFGAIQTLVRVREGSLRRAEADSWMARRSIPQRFRWRVDELTSVRERALLGRSLRGIADDLAPGRLPGACPLDRVALWPHAPLVLDLADRLDRLERPVAPAGVLRVQRLLTGPESPLYLGAWSEPEARALEVERALKTAIEGLEVR